MNGMVTVFMLALLTGRVFLIDSESPLPLELFFEPRALDWRVPGGLHAGAGLRHHSYHDKRVQFQDDIGRLVGYPDETLVVNMNYRMLRSLFEAPELRGNASAWGFPMSAPPFLVADLFDTLFKPSAALEEEVKALQEELGLKDRRFIAVHFRTGNIAFDPKRHDASSFLEFLECAKVAEDESRLPEDTPWFLATDSSELAEAAKALPEAQSGKLRIPRREGRIHLDRSDLRETLEGTLSNYAEWWLYGRAAAAVLSRSFFGETAAEVGRVPRSYFAPSGCVRTDLTSS